MGTKDGVGSECTKMIKLFILKADCHISYCWVLKMLLCWDGKPKAQLSQKDTLWKANKEKGKNVQTVSFMNEIKKGGHFYDLIVIRLICPDNPIENEKEKEVRIEV